MRTQVACCAGAEDPPGLTAGLKPESRCSKCLACFTDEEAVLLYHESISKTTTGTRLPDISQFERALDMVRSDMYCFVIFSSDEKNRSYLNVGRARVWRYWRLRR